MVGFAPTKLTRVWEPALLWNQFCSLRVLSEIGIYQQQPFQKTYEAKPSLLAGNDATSQKS